MKVSEIMDRKLVAVSPTTSVNAALRMLKTSGVGLLIVVESGKLVGVVGEDDILNHISSNQERANDAVRTIVKRPIFAEANDTITSAIEKAMENHLARLPIVDSASTMHCIGIVTASELLRAAGHK